MVIRRMTEEVGLYMHGHEWYSNARDGPEGGEHE